MTNQCNDLQLYIKYTQTVKSNKWYFNIKKNLYRLYVLIMLKKTSFNVFITIIYNIKMLLKTVIVKIYKIKMLGLVLITC